MFVQVTYAVEKEVKKINTDITVNLYHMSFVFVINDI